MYAYLCNMNSAPAIDYKDVLSLFLPKGILDYFDITEASNMGEYYMLCLVERDIIPAEYLDLPLVSMGFHAPVTMTDFPVRDHTMYLRVTRRRWRDKVTGKSYSRNWSLVAADTRITAEFGAFLKELPSLSNGELYTILTNKDGHGRQGTLVAMIEGVKSEEIVKRLMRLPAGKRAKVKSVTMDICQTPCTRSSVTASPTPNRLLTGSMCRS